MKNCPNCQQPLADDARFCPACGNAVPVASAATPAFCPQCGSPMEEGSKFCTECGASVAAVAAAVVPPVAPPVTPAPAAPKRKKHTGLLIGIWTAGIAILLVLALLVSWSFGLFGGGPFGEGGLFGTVSSQSDDDDDDDHNDDDPSDPSNPSDPGDPSTPDDYPTAPSEPVPLPKPIEHIELTVWAPQEAITSGWLSSMEAAFEEQYRDSYVIRWVNQVVSEADAKHEVLQDVGEAGDVYMFANDQLGELIYYNALLPLSGDVLSAVQENTPAGLLNAVTHGDRVYGIPYTGNTWFMYYDKSVFTEEDIKSLDAMLAKDKVAFPLDNGWYLSAFYFANGGTIYGPGGTNPNAGIQFGGEAGTAATKYLVDLAKHPNFSADQVGNGHADFMSGKIKAYFSGYWEYEQNKKALGDNLGCAVLPSITIDGQQKQMCAFTGSNAVGVNPNTENPEMAQRLAAFLTSAEAQLARYQLCGTHPCDASLMDAMAGAPVIQAELAVYASCARVQPMLPVSYWNSCALLAQDILFGSVTHENAAEKTEEFNAAMNGTAVPTAPVNPSISVGGDVGNLCYDQELNRIGQDGTISVQDTRGKVTVINFWGAWCGPCVAELINEFPNVTKEYGDKVAVLAVHSNMGYDSETMPEYIQENFLDSDIIFCTDGEGETYCKLLGGGISWPHTVILDAEGVIVKIIARATTYEELKPIIDGIMTD